MCSLQMQLHHALQVQLYSYEAKERQAGMQGVGEQFFPPGGLAVG